jgi:hypothetical protein
MDVDAKATEGVTKQGGSFGISNISGDDNQGRFPILLLKIISLAIRSRGGRQKVGLSGTADNPTYFQHEYD